MNPTTQRIISICAALTLIILMTPALPAQETRSAIYGRVTDSSGSAVVGAAVLVINAGTNTVNRAQTNETGYYEALLLLPGDYEISVEAAGFKKAIRKGVELPISARSQVDIQLEVGAVTESVSVTAAAPLLETSAVTSGRTLDNRSIRDLPALNNNATLLLRFTPGVQGGAYGYTNPAFTFIGSSFNTAGNVGGSDFSIDGVQSRADRRRVAYQPHPEMLQEFKVETANFDASVGASSGLRVSMMTKAGTNEYHGSLSWQHWRSEWNAAPYFIKKNYNDNLAAAQARGDTNRYDLLKSQVLVPSQHSNNYAAAIGGPVKLPKLYDGKDRLFFFFNFNGLNDRMFRTGYGYRTVPAAAHREGDFSDLLKIDPVRYQIYDPLTARPDPARPGRFIRDPFPNNIIPKNRIINPAYQAYVKLLPPPNVPLAANLEPSLNYVGLVPWRFDYHTWTTRVDYNLSEKHRLFGRALYSRNLEHNQDWLYQHAPGFGEAIGLRENHGATLDWVYTATANTIYNFSASIHEFSESNEPVEVQSVKPSSVGLPTYVDDFANLRGKFHFPNFNISGYDTVATWGPTAHPPGTPKDHRMITFKGDVTHIRGNHTLRGGFDARYSFKTLSEPGNTSGTFGFSNVYTRKDDDGFTPAGTLGLSWAAFMLGLPNSLNIAWNDNAAAYNGFYAGYAQDSWRLTPKLTINGGLRLEYDMGATERYDRMIGALDPNAALPITEAAQAAYARNPLAELSAANFKVRGGSIYPGANGADRKLYRNELLWLPRFGLSYQLKPTTVLQAGYGVYFDVLNVMDFTASFPEQFGYSRSTSTIVTNDFGVNWLVGDPRNGVSPLKDPFPLRADGMRFDEPVRNNLGLMAVQGRGFTYIPYDAKRARQQRWRASLQHQFGSNMVVEVAYAGSWSDRVYVTKPMNVLPEQYWASGNARNNDIANDLNRNVTNPFLLSNFAALQTSHPLIYQDMSRNGFFTSPTIRKHQLLRAFPNLPGLTQSFAPDGFVRTHALEISFTRRLSQGLTFDASYTRLHNWATSAYLNEFDEKPAWLESNQGRPHRVVASGIYELPFGKGRRFARNGALSWLAGGWQVAATFEWQPGPLIQFPNLFYYGNIEDIKKGERTLDRWFNTDNFERTATRAPAAFHRRVFPLQIDGLRADGIKYTNANLQRDFRIKERIQLQLRADVLNLFNRQSFGGPDTNPVSTNFGRVLTDANGPNRFVQAQARLRF